MSNYIRDARLSVAEIMALNDEQIGRYLKLNRYLVTVKDPDNINEPFKERLSAITLSIKFAAVNPQELEARLLEAPAYKERPVRTPSPSSSNTTFIGEYDERMLMQTEAYQDLVNRGGRPSHPLERMEDIVSDPGEYREILAAWQENDQDWEVFGPQATNWKKFQDGQRLVREGPPTDETYILWGTHKAAWPSFAQRFPEDMKSSRGFPEYVQSAQEHLAKYGFVRPFELNRDSAKQDKLTTWIEYINWEYMWYEEFLSWEKKSRHRYDEAWKKLVDSGQLRHGETEDELLTDEHSTNRSRELLDAEQELEWAKSGLTSDKRRLATTHKSTTNLPELQQRVQIVKLPDLQQRVQIGQARLARSEDKFSRVKRRNDCIKRFIRPLKNWHCAKSKAERQPVLLRWALQQIPLIEQEEGTSDDHHPVEQPNCDAARSNPAAGGADAEGKPTSDSHKRLASTLLSNQDASSSSRTIKRTRDVENSDGPSPKKAKCEHNTTAKAQDCAIASLNDQQGSSAAITTASKPQTRGKRKMHTRKDIGTRHADQQQVSHQANPRRSARIAQQRQTLNSTAKHAPSTQSQK